jgi:hypothetical protein
MTNNPRPGDPDGPEPRNSESANKDSRRRPLPPRSGGEPNGPLPTGPVPDISFAGLLDGLILPDDLFVESPTPDNQTPPQQMSSVQTPDTQTPDTQTRDTQTPDTQTPGVQTPPPPDTTASEPARQIRTSALPQPVSGAAPELASEPSAADPATPARPLVTALKPMFDGATPFLARFLPAVTPSHVGIQTGFCNLHDFLRFLHDQDWYGFLHAGLGEQAAYVLVFEGRTVAAAGLSSTGEQALGELLHLYDQGAPLSAFPLGRHLAHILSGVGSRAWKFNLTDDFTGLHARPGEAVFYDGGQIVATMPSGLPYEGAFPAPLRPQTLILPRSLAGWAHHGYAATLRGRDAVNAITTGHQNFRARYGAAGLSFQKALVDGLTPAEYALRHDVALHDLEAQLKELIAAGYLKDE